MLDGLFVDVVDRLQRRAGELELAAGLQRDVRPAAVKADQGLAFAHVLPAEALHAFEHGEDAGVALIGHGLERSGPEGEFLVFRADAVRAGRLAPFGEVGRQGLHSQRRIFHDGLPHALSQLKRGGPSPVCNVCNCSSHKRLGS